MNPLNRTEVCTLRTRPDFGHLACAARLFRPAFGRLLFLERFRYSLLPIALDLEHLRLRAGLRRGS